MTKPKMNVSKPQKPSKASIAREGDMKEALGPQDLYKLLKPLLANLVQEVAWSISLDCAARVIAIDEIGRGAIDHVEIGPRELFRPAIENAASYVVMAHYHPSGEKMASPQDIELTRRMLSCGQILQIPVIDHMVVTNKGFTTLSQVMPEFLMPELIPPYKADAATIADSKATGEKMKKFDKPECTCRACKMAKQVLNGGAGIKPAELNAMLASLDDKPEPFDKNGKLVNPDFTFNMPDDKSYEDSV